MRTGPAGRRKSNRRMNDHFCPHPKFDHATSQKFGVTMADVGRVNDHAMLEAGMVCAEMMMRMVLLAAVMVGGLMGCEMRTTDAIRPVVVERDRMPKEILELRIIDSTHVFLRANGWEFAMTRNGGRYEDRRHFEPGNTELVLNANARPANEITLTCGDGWVWGMGEQWVFMRVEGDRAIFHHSDRAFAGSGRSFHPRPPDIDEVLSVRAFSP